MSILRPKSAELYKKRFSDYVDYCKENKLQLKVGIYQYLIAQSNVYSPTTMQSHMSMIKRVLLNELNLKLDTERAQAYLNTLHVQHKKKKARVFTKQQIEVFFKKTGNEGKDLMNKVAINLALYGGLRIKELTGLQVEHLKMEKGEYHVNIVKSKTDTSSEGFMFVIPKLENSIIYPCNLLQKYLTRLPDLSGRLFRYPNKNNNMFSKRVVGKNSLAMIPLRIATTLKLNNPKAYTGHALRRTATTWLADEGCSTMDLMRFGRWKSYTVARGYVEKSLFFKRQIAKRMATCILRKTLKNNNTVETTKKVVHISNNSGCTINLNF